MCCRSVNPYEEFINMNDWSFMEKDEFKMTLSHNTLACLEYILDTKNINQLEKYIKMREMNDAEIYYIIRRYKGIKNITIKAKILECLLSFCKKNDDMRPYIVSSLIRKRLDDILFYLTGCDISFQEVKISKCAFTRLIKNGVIENKCELKPRSLESESIDVIQKMIPKICRNTNVNLLEKLEQYKIYPSKKNQKSLVIVKRNKHHKELCKIKMYKRQHNDLEKNKYRKTKNSKAVVNYVYMLKKKINCTSVTLILYRL